MKNAFTLIELIIVMIIVSILLGSISFLSWSYLSELNIQNEKETIEGDFFYTQTLSLSQPSFGKINDISYVGIKLSPEKDYMQDIVLTGELINFHPIYRDTKSFSYIKFGTGINLYSGTNLEKTIVNEAYILYKPYTMGAILVEDDEGTYNIYTGSYVLKFAFDTIYSKKICFSLALNSGRLYSTSCNN